MGNFEIQNIEGKINEIKKLLDEPHRSSFDLFDRGLDQGILTTLEILEIKINGVND